MKGEDDGMSTGVVGDVMDILGRDVDAGVAEHFAMVEQVFEAAFALLQVHALSISSLPSSSLSSAVLAASARVQKGWHSFFPQPGPISLPLRSASDKQMTSGMIRREEEAEQENLLNLKQTKQIFEALSRDNEVVQERLFRRLQFLLDIQGQRDLRLTHKRKCQFANSLVSVSILILSSGI